MVVGFSSKALDMGSLIQMLHESQASFCYLYTIHGILDAFQITSIIYVVKIYFGFSTTSYLGTCYCFHCPSICVRWKTCGL